MKDILLLTLGGTIESHYNPEEGTPKRVPLEKGSIIPEAIRHLGLQSRCDIVPICLEDSSDLTGDEVRRAIQAIADRDGYQKIVVVQGTNTMPDNGRLFEKRLKRLGIEGKILVFTGAMEPLRDKDGQLREGADGWDNLKRAFEEVDRQPPGAYFVIDQQCRLAEGWSKYVKTDDKGNVIASGFTPPSS